MNPTLAHHRLTCSSASEPGLSTPGAWSGFILYNTLHDHFGVGVVRREAMQIIATFR